jgi:hypothetical protein
MKVNIQKSSYQIAKPQEDNVVYDIDDKIHTMYLLEINENYFIEDKEEAIKEIIKDLKELTKDLEIELKKHTRNSEREV